MCSCSEVSAGGRQLDVLACYSLLCEGLGIRTLVQVKQHVLDEEFCETFPRECQLLVGR